MLMLRGYTTLCLFLMNTLWLGAQLLYDGAAEMGKGRAVETTFELAGGLIFIPGGGESAVAGDYLLDTGAPTLILNQKERDVASGTKMVSLGGSAAVGCKKVRNFAVRGVNLGTIYSYTTDLSHLERVKRKAICGILGYKVFRSLELFIDYDKRYLLLFEAGSSVLHQEVQPKETIRFYQKGHFPIVKVKIGGRNYFFGLDTGAEVNVFSLRWLKRMKRKFPEHWMQKNIQGINRTSVSSQACTLPAITVGETTYSDLDFVFTDLSHLNRGDGFELDGILGFPFLSSGKFSINYKNRRLYLWNNPLEELAERAIVEVIPSQDPTAED